MKKTKIIEILLICIILLLIGTNISLGTTINSKIDDITDHGVPGNTGEWLKGMGWNILTIVQAIGASISIIMITILGIKYIMAAPDEKAQVKKSAVIFVIGAIIFFAATGILQFIAGFIEGW